jgi:alpha-L-fucosidase
MTEIGVIFHWGIYSVPAYDSIASVKRRSMQNGSEWYLKRLSQKADGYRPVAGYKETQKFHAENYANVKYEDFAKSFTAEKYNPEEWMKVAKSIKATYVILTAKHHDGYCLFPQTPPTNTTEEHKDATDKILQFKQAAVKHGLKFGVYYSWTEFNKSCTKKYLNDTVLPHMKTLMAYKPDIWWFDGDWDCKTQYAQKVIDDCCDDIRKSHPAVLINDRIGNKKLRKDVDYLGRSSYRVYSDREIPAVIPKVKWEHINTIGYSWGRNKQQQKEDYKTGCDLFKLYTQVKDLKVNFLINMGPNADGTLCQEEVTALTDFGKLLV